jgi:acyl-CoA reductase-like NAD-dependent aldehyde dehydrogenase
VTCVYRYTDLDEAIATAERAARSAFQASIFAQTSTSHSTQPSGLDASQ